MAQDDNVVEDSVTNDSSCKLHAAEHGFGVHIKNTFIEVLAEDEDVASVGAVSAPERHLHRMLLADDDASTSEEISANQDHKNISPLILENALESLLSRLCAAHDEAKLEVAAQKLRVDLGLDTDETSQDEQHLKT